MEVPIMPPPTMQTEHSDGGMVVAVEVVEVVDEVVAVALEVVDEVLIVENRVEGKPFLGEMPIRYDIEPANEALRCN